MTTHPLSLYNKPLSKQRYLLDTKKLILRLFLSILLASAILAGALLYSTSSTFSAPAPSAAAPLNALTTYSPVYSDREINNPYIGFVGVAENTEPLVPIKLAFASVSWKELEPEKGVYDFEAFEKRCNFDYWRKKGVTLVFRFYMDYPSDEGAADIPYWLYKEINKDGDWYFGDERHQGFSPNYANPLVKEYHSLAIKALAERYNNDDLISFVELGSVGHWGEWHTTYVDHDKSPFPGVSVTDAYVMDYISNFTNKKLLMRRSFEIAKKYNLGLFNDMFGDIEQTEKCFIGWFTSGYISNNNKEAHPAMPLFWQTAPSGGEMANKPSFQYISEETINRTVKQLIDSHTSWLGPSGPFYEEMTDTQLKNLSRLQKLMGYRFFVKHSEFSTRFPAGSGFTGTLNINNSGVAPFYFDWQLQMSVADAAGTEQFTQSLDADIKKILPGENKVPYSLKTGSIPYAGLYQMRLRMVNPKDTAQEIELANENFTFGSGVHCGEFAIAPTGGFSCDTYRVGGYRNYISYWNSNLTFKVLRLDPAQTGNNKIALTQTKDTSQNWTASLGLGSLSEKFSAVRLMLDGAPLLTVANTKTELKITGDKIAQTIQKAAGQAIKLEARKSGKTIKYYVKVGTGKDVYIGQYKPTTKSKTIKLGTEYTLQTTNAAETLSAGTMSIQNTK